MDDLSVVEQCCVYHIDDGESRLRGAAGPQRWTRCDELAHGGGVVCHHGGVDGMSDIGYADVCPKDGAAVDVGDGFGSMCTRYSSRVC